MSYNKMKLAVGIFVITIFIVTASFSYFLLKEKGTFDKRYSYHFNTQTASSFNVGMPLKFSGFNIGVIDKIALKDDGTVHMTFSVNEQNKKWISKDSVLVIKKPLIGSPHIELYSALGNPILDAGATLMILMSDDINDMISKLEPAVNKITNIINNIDSMTATFAKEDSELMRSVQNIQLFTHKLAHNDSLLTSITGDKESTLNLVKSLNTTSEIMHEMHEISKEVNKITSNLNEDIINPSSSTIKELDTIMKDIKQKLDALDSTVKSVGSFDNEIVELKEQISVGIQKSNQIMDKVDALMQDESSDKVVLP